MSPRISTVLFDVGGTILRVHPSVGTVYSQVAAEHGIDVSPAVIETGFRAAWSRSLERSEGRGYKTSDDLLRSEWLEIVRETFGQHVPPARLDGLFGDLYERFASKDAWRVVPGIRESISFLRSQGIRLGVLSNWDSRLRRMLADFQLDAAFDFLVVSHEVGFEKPHPSIFREALRCAAAPPIEVLHVGDSHAADVAPARSLGMRTLWVESGEHGVTVRSGGSLGGRRASESSFWREILAATWSDP